MKRVGRVHNGLWSIRALTANCGNGTTSLAQYGKYDALEKALTMKPEDVVAEIKASRSRRARRCGLPNRHQMGRRAKAPDQKVRVCNADESEPGTFKDRILLLDDPHRTIEGMCDRCVCHRRKQRLHLPAWGISVHFACFENALNEAREANLLGDLLAPSFDIEIRVGAGAYICGEETALFESIEGKRGFPACEAAFPHDAWLVWQADRHQ
jgi:NADH-quinone oxidoreductase subunit F